MFRKKKCLEVRFDGVQRGSFCRRGRERSFHLQGYLFTFYRKWQLPQLHSIQGKRERESNTLLHKDKDLSTNRLFYKSVLNDKTLNTSNNTNNCGKLKHILRTKQTTTKEREGLGRGWGGGGEWRRKKSKCVMYSLVAGAHYSQGVAWRGHVQLWDVRGRGLEKNGPRHRQGSGNVWRLLRDGAYQLVNAAPTRRWNCETACHWHTEEEKTALRHSSDVRGVHETVYEAWWFQKFKRRVVVMMNGVVCAGWPCCSSSKTRHGGSVCDWWNTSGAY